MKIYAATAVLLLSLGAAQAGDFSRIDPNTFIVQPPASVRWTVRNTNTDHPAVIVARQKAAIDTNTYLVQPPATTSWTVQPEPQTRTVAQVR